MNLTSPKNWKTVKLGDIGKVITGKTPSKDHPEHWGDVLPFVTPTDFKGDLRYLYNTDRFLSDEGISAFQRIVIPENSVLVTCIGSDMGKVALVKNDVVTNQQINSLIPTDQFDSSIVYYALKNSYDALRTLAGGGSTMPIVNKSTFENFEIQIPESLEDQKEIAAILGSLDDKIELLRRENKTLESIAQALFREWFVELRFPGYEGVKVVDGVPEGWKVGKLTDIAEFLNGVASQKYPAENKSESLPVIKIREMKSGITTDTDRATSKIDPVYIVKSGDMLFSWSGSLDIVLWNDVDGVLNQHLFKVTSENYPKWFYYYWVLQHLPEFKTIAESKATTMGHIQRHHLDDAEVLIPSEKTFVEMNNAMTPLLDKQILNNLEIRTLSKLRDGLLNKIFNV